MSEYVYILTNPTIPDLVKIGRTTNLEERLRSLSSHKGVSVPYECYYCCEVADGNDIEKRLHFGLGDHPFARFVHMVSHHANRGVVDGTGAGESKCQRCRKGKG